MVPNGVGNDRRTRRHSANNTVEKRAHTDKNLVLVNGRTQKVVYLSPTQPGKKHDKKQADEAAIVYSAHVTLGQDTGFLGYQPTAVLVWQLKKKPRGQALTDTDKYLNGLLSSARIVVERTLASVKPCHIAKDVFHDTKVGVTDMVMELACALDNLRVSFRHPLPTFNILTLAT
jgi:hypothetical protein